MARHHEIKRCYDVLEYCVKNDTLEGPPKMMPKEKFFEAKKFLGMNNSMFHFINEWFEYNGIVAYTPEKYPEIEAELDRLGYETISTKTWFDDEKNCYRANVLVETFAERNKFRISKAELDNLFIKTCNMVFKDDLREPQIADFLKNIPLPKMAPLLDKTNKSKKSKKGKKRG